MSQVYISNWLSTPNLLFQFLFMALRRYMFSSKKEKGCRYLNICVSMYILNGSLPSSAKTYILLVAFLTPNACLHSDT